MPDHEITMQRKPSLNVEFWAFYNASRSEAIAITRDLLDALHESGYKKAKVFLNGKKILLKRVDKV